MQSFEVKHLSLLKELLRLELLSYVRTTGNFWAPEPVITRRFHPPYSAGPAIAERVNKYEVLSHESNRIYISPCSNRTWTQKYVISFQICNNRANLFKICLSVVY